MLYTGNTVCTELKTEQDNVSNTYRPGDVKRDMRAAGWFLVIGMLANGSAIIAFLYSSIFATEPLIGKRDFVLGLIAFLVLLICYIALMRFRRTLSASSWKVEINCLERTISAKNKSRKICRNFGEYSFVRIAIPGNSIGSVKMKSELFAVRMHDEPCVVPLFLSTSKEAYESTVQTLIQRVPGVDVVEMDCSRKIGAWGTVPSDWNDC